MIMQPGGLRFVCTAAVPYPLAPLRDTMD